MENCASRFAPGLQPGGMRGILVLPVKPVIGQMVLGVEQLAPTEADVRMAFGLQRRAPPQQIRSPAFDVMNDDAKAVDANHFGGPRQRRYNRRIPG
jgi:hypothetical protein